MKLSVHELSKKYKKKDVLKKINFEVQEGEVLGILGPNGAGKTTLLKIILGLIKATNGSVKILDDSKNTRSTYCFGALLESTCFYETLSGKENLEYFQEAGGAEEIISLLDLVGLNEQEADLKVKKYSYGMKQKLGIAQALLGNKPIVVLDEPLNGLDAKGIYDIRNLIRKLAKEENKIVVLTGHILSEIEKVADKVLVIDKGSVLYEGYIREIAKSYIISLNQFPSESLKQDLMSCFGKDMIGFKSYDILLHSTDIKLLKDVISNVFYHDIYVCGVKKCRNLEDFYFSLIEEKR